MTATPNLVFAAPDGVKRNSGSEVIFPTIVIEFEFAILTTFRDLYLLSIFLAVGCDIYKRHTLIG